MASMIALDYFLHGLADAIAGGAANPPAAARILNIAGESAFVVAFFLLALSPLLLFPTGRLPSRHWRWAAGAGIVGCGAAVLSVQLAPGPGRRGRARVGRQPARARRRAPAGRRPRDGGVACCLPAGSWLGLAAFVTRWVRYRGPRRQQMAWFTIGVVVQVTGLATDTDGDSVTVEVLLATAIFGTMLFGIGWPLLGPLGSRAESAEHVARAKSEAEPAPLASSVDGPTVAT